jgi:hypothetical protein
MRFSIFSRDNDEPIIALLNELSAKQNETLTKLGQISTSIQQVLTKEIQMAATIADLDKAIANDDALEASLETSIQANTVELQALKALVAPDLQPQVDKILARQTALASAIQTLQAADAANAPA